ncbi:hypothetical protein NIB75_06450 [Bacteroides uniformis]|nr:hypothetical protein [Bacteroides uniformis]
METMQVCCPVYPPVQGDTRVQLVSAGIEALQSGGGSEKDGRASQLVPFISHFGRGYWEALTQAADNGAGTDLLEAMIRNSCLGLGEQICLLCGKVSASVHAAFCRVYPEEGSLLDVIEWQGKEYPIREADTVPGDGTGNGNNRIGHRIAEEAHRTQERRTRFKKPQKGSMKVFIITVNRKRSSSSRKKASPHL